SPSARRPSRRAARGSRRRRSTWPAPSPRGGPWPSVRPSGSLLPPVTKFHFVLPPIVHQGDDVVRLLGGLIAHHVDVVHGLAIPITQFESGPLRRQAGREAQLVAFELQAAEDGRESWR